MFFPFPDETDLPQSHCLDGNADGRRKGVPANGDAQCQVAASLGFWLFPFARAIPKPVLAE